MNEEEKDIIMQLSSAIPKLDKEKQNYIVGLVEGMVFAKESQQDEPLAVAT